MFALVDFVFFIISGLLGLLIIALIVAAVLSWLVAFDIINLRNRLASSLYYGLQRLTEPLLSPIRRFVPPLGGVDLSFIVLFLLLQGTRSILLPAAYNAIRGLLI
ncbi:MAG: YggT family protein [Caulobacter sp.]|nr:YggT family protein [Caulobacter sp.]